MGDFCRNCGGGVKMDRPGRSYLVVKDGVIIRLTVVKGRAILYALPM